MCLAIYAPVGVRIARERLSNGWNNNPDGGGYAFINDDGEVTARHFLEWPDFIAGYERDSRANTKSPFIIHQRFATHGTKDETNVHPFSMDDNTVVIHNGILDVNMKQDKRSDTRTFVEDYLAKLPMGWMDDPDLAHMVEEFIGYGNKLVILTSDPYARQDVYIFNEKRGHWDRGAWWSNDGYKPRHLSTKWRGFGAKESQNRTGVVTPFRQPTLPGTSSGGPHPVVLGSSKPSTPIQSIKAGAAVGDWNDPRIEEDDESPYPNGWPVCWLCGDNPNVGPVCFTCEWCTEHATELWVCNHINDQQVVTEYVQWYSNLTADDRLVHDAYVLEAAPKTVADLISKA